MDPNIIKEEIRRTFEALTEQMQIINENIGRIPQIEIDLIMENFREIYASFKELDRLNTQAGRPASVVTEREIQRKEVVEVPIRNFSLIDIDDVDTSGDEIPPVVEKEPETVYQHVPAPEIQPEPAPVEDIAETARVPEDVPVAEPKIVTEQPVTQYDFPPAKPASRAEGDLFSGTYQPSVSDKFKDDRQTLNDRLQQEKTDRSIGSRLQQNHISDIKSAIGINEKFQFINELFGGSMQDYSMAITQLNQLSNNSEASSYIDILKFKYNWDMNADSYRKFMEILRRRYPE